MDVGARAISMIADVRSQFFLIDSMFLQLALFFTVTAISLWVDQLRNSEIAVLAEHSPLYYALFIFTIVVRRLC